MTAAADAIFPTPMIFGIMNVTPDSFSDGGEIVSVDAALQRSEQLLESGADILDIGAESTRPGAATLSEDQEWERLAPVLDAVSRRGLMARVSVDTRKPGIMFRVATMGCQWINCVGPLPDEEQLRQLKKIHSGLGFVAMHMHRDPASMQMNPLSAKGAVKRVEAFFESTLADLTSCGYESSQILLDPGIGFGKTDAANLALMGRCSGWSRTLPIAVGISRKSIFQRLLGVTAPKDRDVPSKVAETALAMSGVKMIRTHDVAGLSRCLRAVRGG